MQLDIDRLVRETFVARAEYHPCLDSTNDHAAECAREPNGELPLLIVAERQTVGRGRGTNRWWTGAGALAFSLLVDARTVGADHGPTPLAALAAAVAVAETVGPLLPDHQVGIHWPNDIMAGGRKLAGILIEALPDRRHVVGIGLNANNTLADAPQELRSTAVTLRDLAGRSFDRNAILIDLLNHLECEFARLCYKPEQVAATADRWCLQQGAMLTLERGGRTIAGRCRGIAPDGAIRLKTAAGEETFYSGTLIRST